jgi:predicted AlkP superfamily phosphohydrolase/phosphomutase
VILVLGIDAATWTVVRPNLDKLSTFKKLCNTGKSRDLVVKQELISASVWCGMFCGKTPEEHGHHSYTVDGNNVPFIVPPYSFGVDFKPVGFGLPTNEKEWQEELEKVTEKTKELLQQELDLLVSVYTLLDRVQHFHWGEDCVLDWYRKLDDKIGELVFESGFAGEKDNSLIVISDHGFCSFGEAKIQTLPEETEHGRLKGDHHENALLITVNVDFEIDTPQDVFHAILSATR